MPKTTTHMYVRLRDLKKLRIIAKKRDMQILAVMSMIIKEWMEANDPLDG